MPQIRKGGKWIFAWVVVSEECVICIPPEACHEYGFEMGEALSFTRGSRRSGGFGIGKTAVLSVNEPIRSRVLGEALMGENMRVTLPAVLKVVPGERLLAVRGSGLALGFLQRGPIYEEALKHPEIEKMVSQ